MRQFYSKETGWTEVGIKEQKRRADLTKLTAEELLAKIGIPAVINPTNLCAEIWAEIVSRLERLEKCEAAIDVVLTGGNHLASVLIGRLGADDKSFPPYGTPIDKVQAQLSMEDADIWIAWRAIMLLRDAARAALDGK